MSDGGVCWVDGDSQADNNIPQMNVKESMTPYRVSFVNEAFIDSKLPGKMQNDGFD